MRGAFRPSGTYTHRVTTWVATVAMHDRDGNALHTIRYGAMPDDGCEGLLHGIAGDVNEFPTIVDAASRTDLASNRRAATFPSSQRCPRRGRSAWPLRVQRPGTIHHRNARFGPGGSATR
jgi:hypothetical protein